MIVAFGNTEKKLSGANELLAKTKYYLPSNLCKTLYSSIFEAHFRYGC